MLKLMEKLLSHSFDNLNHNTKNKTKIPTFCTSQCPNKPQNREALCLTNILKVPTIQPAFLMDR